MAAPMNAYTANRITNAPTVIPGQATETSPMTMASRPRHSSADDMDENIEQSPSGQ
jgi:hypothetical protein